MELRTALDIVQKARELGLSITLYAGYSGRDMLGKMTTAIVADSDIDVIQACSSLLGNIEDIQDVLKFNKQICSFRVDEFGKGLIYF